MISQERIRQMTVERWDNFHDDKHTGKQLARAAESYLATHTSPDLDAIYEGKPQRETWQWPWSKKWWKPSDEPIRNLVKAGALIAAEIDRLERRATVKRLQKAAKGGAR